MGFLILHQSTTPSYTHHTHALAVLTAFWPSGRAARDTAHSDHTSVPQTWEARKWRKFKGANTAGILEASFVTAGEWAS